jgi:hypothetical protein
LQPKSLAKKIVEAMRQQKRKEKEDKKAQQVVDSFIVVEQLKGY